MFLFFHVKLSLYPKIEEGWFGQPKYSTPSKNHTTLCRFLLLYSSMFYSILFLIKGETVNSLGELTLVLGAILYGIGFYFGWQPQGFRFYEVKNPCTLGVKSKAVVTIEASFSLQ